MFKLGFGKKNTQEEEPPIVINEQMLIADLDPSIQSKIVSIFQNSMDNATFQMPETGPELDSSLEFLKESTEKELFGPLTSLAHQIDNGKKTVYDFKQELNQSKQDLGGSYHNTQTPTPFIRRFVADLKTQYYELDQSIKTVESSLSSNVSSEEFYQEMFPELYLAEALQKEHQSINRLSSKVSALKSHFDEIDEVYEQKSHFADASAGKDSLASDGSNQTKQEEEISFDTADKIETQYQQFLSQKKNKERNRIEKNDLFGSAPVAITPAKTIGSGLKPANTTFQSASNRPKTSNPPPNTTK